MNSTKKREQTPTNARASAASCADDRDGPRRLGRSRPARSSACARRRRRSAPDRAAQRRRPAAVAARRWRGSGTPIASRTTAKGSRNEDASSDQDRDKRVDRQPPHTVAIASPTVTDGPIASRIARAARASATKDTTAITASTDHGAARPAVSALTTAIDDCRKHDQRQRDAGEQPPVAREDRPRFVPRLRNRQTAHCIPSWQFAGVMRAPCTPRNALPLAARRHLRAAWSCRPTSNGASATARAL